MSKYRDIYLDLINSKKVHHIIYSMVCVSQILACNLVMLAWMSSIRIPLGITVHVPEQKQLNIRGHYEIK